MSTFAEQYTEGETGQGRRYWKASAYTGAYAILIEVEDYKAGVPVKPRKGSDKTEENQAYVSLTTFDSMEDIEAGVGTEFLNVKIAQTLLARDLEKHVGKLLVKRLGVWGENEALVWKSVEGPIVQAVGRYYDAREAKKAESTAVLEGDDESVPAWARGEA